MFVSVQAATAAIHVAFVACSAIGADGAALNLDVGVVAHMAVLARTEHRAVNHGSILDGYHSVLHKGHIGVCLTCLAMTGAKHMAIRVVVIAWGIQKAINANYTALNGDRGLTGKICSILLWLLIGDAYRRNVAAAIHVAAHAPALDGNVGVAVHLTGGDAVVLACGIRISVQAATAAIHVAVVPVAA